MPNRSTRKTNTALIIVLAVPFMLASGFLYGFLAQKLSKGREPWCTFLMLIGLACTIGAIEWVSGDFKIRTVWLFLGAAFLYVALRLLFGRGGAQPLEAFIMPHICAILACILFPSLDLIKAKRAHRTILVESHQN